MKKITLLLLLFSISVASAQNLIKADPLYAWTGYAEWSNADGTESGGTAWGLANVKTTFDGDYSITLQPNFSTYANAVAVNTQAELDYWTDGQGGGGKIFEGTTKIDLDPSFNGQDLTFSGYVVSNTLDSEYSVTYFIKALNPATGYSDVIEGTSATINGTGAFSISADGTDLASGLILQVGFTVTGLNANPSNESTLGSVVIVANASTASVNDNIFNAVKMYPNPAKGVVNFSSASNVALDVAVFDMLGKQVLRANAVQSQLNISSLNPGMYFVKMTQGSNVSTKKLLVN